MAFPFSIFSGSSDTRFSSELNGGSIVPSKLTLMTVILILPKDCTRFISSPPESVVSSKELRSQNQPTHVFTCNLLVSSRAKLGVPLIQRPVEESLEDAPIKCASRVKAPEPFFIKSLL